MSCLARYATSRSAFFGYQQRFVFRGRSYAIRKSGQRLLRLLSSWQRVINEEESRALSLRADIDRVVQSPPTTLLCFLIYRINDPLLIRMLMLIVRRGRVHAATKQVFFKYENLDPRARRDVVRTLEKMAAWRELAIIADKCRFEDTREMACEKQRPSFQTRLSQFSEITSVHATGEHHPSLKVAVGTELTRVSPRAAAVRSRQRSSEFTF